MQYGMTSLHTNELLAILLRSGCKGKSAIELADEVLALRKPLSNLFSLTYGELMHIKGIKKAKALEILACFELSRRMSLMELNEKDVIRHPKSLIAWLNKQIGYHEQEHFLVVFLNHKNEIISYQDMFIGQRNSCQVAPNEVFTQALRIGAYRIILVHNHPSGDVTPSEEDVMTTQRFLEIGKLCGIECLDHVIVGHNRYFSFKEKQMIAS